MPQIGILLFGFLALTTTILANNHSCPADRPYPRGNDACDSCPWKETIAEYQAGNLSEIRDSKVLNHQIRVSVVCDVNRSVDIEDVFDKVDETEWVFNGVFGDFVEHDDGDGVLLEVIVGICDYYGLVDDCNMYEVCNTALDRLGCEPDLGQSFANMDGLVDHVAFIPYAEEGKYHYIEGNRWVNLHHEVAHLLDYTYIRRDNERRTDSDWWVEGMAQFVQWKILNDSLSWNRGNNNAQMMEIFAHRENTRDYYDGLRIIAYLDSFAPNLLEEVVKDLRNGIYKDRKSRSKWRSLISYIASSHEASYRKFVDSVGNTVEQKSGPRIEGYCEKMDWKPKECRW